MNTKTSNESNEHIHFIFLFSISIHIYFQINPHMYFIFQAFIFQGDLVEYCLLTVHVQLYLMLNSYIEFYSES